MKMDEGFLRYSALDSACTLEIRNAIWDQLDPSFRKAYDLTMNILPVLMFMQTRGVRVNRGRLEETKIDVLREAAKKQEELNSLCGRAINVNSSKQVAGYFYDELGIPAYKGKTGGVTTDDMALQRLVRGTVARPGLRQAKLVQDIRGMQKLYGTYLDLEFDADDRIRCSYNPRGTKFGRLSSSKTIFGTGTNFQNLPSEFKSFLEPDPGYVFIEVDKRQAEWVVVAYATGDANMISAIERGIDVHLHTSSLMFHLDPEIIAHDNKIIGHSTDADAIFEMRSSDPILSKVFGRDWPRSMSLRQCGKKSNHGLNYDEGFRGFAMINEIDEKEAKRIVDMYHHIYPGIRIWYESVKRSLQKDRTLTNCFGRTVRFLDAWNDSLFKSAYSMLPQSTVVDSLNEGMVKTYEDTYLTQEVNGDILAQVHDSILMQFPVENLKDETTFNNVIGRITDYTSPDLFYSGRDFRIQSDYKAGFNWGEHHASRNPDGMAEFKTYEQFMKIITAGTTNGEGAGRVA